MVGVNLVVSETDEEAQRQFTTLQQMFLGVVTGQREKIQPPKPIEEDAPEHVLSKVDQTLSIKAVGICSRRSTRRCRSRRSAPPPRWCASSRRSSPPRAPTN